ncbi:HAD superfamily hydrolase (TIGR01509 family) [Streptomyces sp. SAI-135]|uniref:HAD family hydrolase n=1 Tax=unclassified Streptomyces TaxID=2593676 RepID=UPI002473587F|nr:MULTISPECIES: HAD-IA family hydrolase [unclassified Streptomyces]MDH6520874.1 HAD superfamily hydrolase (TIGR01509 family) [Streptomyces sp. SAI-090]MDH6572176.1 HAD superfamily hydrolase (TIGR01509 family) [Streptomyces sp. SAI-117]MDH6582865.1 HAD superfamily hydrolase (TIGR01509 family) [Streptomyces sp. SAI-133]MDH6615035.1 HAD superfamily hydrolase (TIGR01509 family) [Streptomyces sp. SAI-135]
MTAVLFDFSGTLFRVESTESWLRAVLDEAELPLAEAELTRTARELEHVGALPGGTAPRVPMPDALAAVWGVRDESAELHRAAYTGLSRLVTLPDPALHDALYDRHMLPAAWRPYPDAAEVLRALRERGAKVGVVSNIGWDLRPVFRAHGLDRYVDAYVLSYEHGVQKPDPRLFEAACTALAVEPRDVLMVGDDRRADGGAAALGCGVHFVDHLPAAQRPDALRPVLDLVG